MPLVINSYRHAAAGGTPLLNTSTAYWICKNNATYFSSGADTVLDKVGARHLQRGDSVGVDTADPVFSNDGAYEHLRFDGSNDRMFTADHDDLDSGTGDFTAFVTLKFQGTLSGTKIFLSKKVGAENGYSLYTSGTSLAGIYDSGPAYVATHGTAVTTNTRYHIALRKSGANLTIVLDGVASSATTVAGDASSIYEFTIGENANNSGLNAQVDVNGVAWFKGTALSDANCNAVGAEILSLTAV